MSQNPDETTKATRTASVEAPTVKLVGPDEPYLENGLPVFGIALALGDIFKEAGCAENPTEPFDGALWRYFTVIRGSEGIPVVCTAGFSKQNPTVQCPERTVALCQQLTRFVEADDPEAAEWIYSNPLTWGTRNEILHSISEAIRLGLADPNKPAKLVIATNPAHIIRVWLCCMKLKPQLWKVDLRVSHHPFTWRSKLREIPATIIEACRFLRFWKNERVG